jgi:hypothetical protein
MKCEGLRPSMADAADEEPAMAASAVSTGCAPSRGFTFQRRSRVTGRTFPNRTSSTSEATASLSRISRSESRPGVVGGADRIASIAARW